MGMTTRYWLSLLSIGAVACGGAQNNSPPPEPPSESSLAATPPHETPTPVETPVPAPVTETKPTAKAGNNELTANIMRALRGEKGNVFFSATSMRGALGMTALGAQGKTLEEMVQALGIASEPEKNAAAAKAEGTEWKQATGSAELTIANRLWVEKSFSLEKPFLDSAQAGYGAGAVNVDFVKAAEKSRAQINTWVSDTTKGKIKDLLPGGSVTPMTRLVLTNAVYFKGNWTEAFVKTATKDDEFKAAAGPLKTPTMHRTSTMGYAETEKARLVELPYKDSQLAMMVVLPTRADGIDALAAEVTAADVEGWAKAEQHKKVNLSLPKFTFSWGRSVKPELQALGIRTAFTDTADFTKMAAKGKEPLQISDVFHKAFVLVDETGTEAAAATGVVMVTKAAMPDQTVEMKVDRPFLFFIRNTKTGDVLFAGRVMNPKG